MNKQEFLDHVKAEVAAAMQEHLDPIKAAAAAEKAERTAQLSALVAREHGANVTPQEAKKIKAQRVGTFLRALVATGADPSRAAEMAKSWGAGESLVKALGTTTIAAGGAIVPDDMSDTIIELLYPRTVVREAGAMTVPMPNGNLTLPRVASGSTASYVGENQRTTASQPSFDQVKMSAKKLVVHVPVSNELLTDSSPSADRIVMNDMVRGASVRENEAFIRGDGAQDTPIGIRNLPNIQTTATAGTTQQQVADDLAAAQRSLMENNIPMTNPGWLMAPRTMVFLRDQLLDGNGNRVYGEEMSRGTLQGFPFYWSTSIPINLGGGNESELYLADFDELMIGEATVDNMMVQVFPGGSYWDGTQLQSGIANDQTVFALKMRHDFAGRQSGVEAHVTTGLQWGV
jgi:HK97 family phage major capsid protein